MLPRVGPPMKVNLVKTDFFSLLTTICCIKRKERDRKTERERERKKEREREKERERRRERNKKKRKKRKNEKRKRRHIKEPGRCLLPHMNHNI